MAAVRKEPKWTEPQFLTQFKYLECEEGAFTHTGAKDAFGKFKRCYLMKKETDPNEIGWLCTMPISERSLMEKMFLTMLEKYNVVKHPWIEYVPPFFEIKRLTASKPTPANPEPFNILEALNQNKGAPLMCYFISHGGWNLEEHFELRFPPEQRSKECGNLVLEHLEALLTQLEEFWKGIQSDGFYNKDLTLSNICFSMQKQGPKLSVIDPCVVPLMDLDKGFGTVKDDFHRLVQEIITELLIAKPKARNQIFGVVKKLKMEEAIAVLLDSSPKKGKEPEPTPPPRRKGMPQKEDQIGDWEGGGISDDPFKTPPRGYVNPSGCFDDRKLHEESKKRGQEEEEIPRKRIRELSPVRTEPRAKKVLFEENSGSQIIPPQKSCVSQSQEVTILKETYLDEPTYASVMNAKNSVQTTIVPIKKKNTVEDLGVMMDVFQKKCKLRNVAFKIPQMNDFNNRLAELSQSKDSFTCNQLALGEIAKTCSFFVDNKHIAYSFLAYSMYFIKGLFHADEKKWQENAIQIWNFAKPLKKVTTYGGIPERDIQRLTRFGNLLMFINVVRGDLKIVDGELKIPIPQFIWFVDELSVNDKDSLCTAWWEMERILDPTDLKKGYAMVAWCHDNKRLLGN